MIKKLILFLILPVITACSFLANMGPPSLSPHAWLNAPAEQLIVAFGVPDSSVSLDNCEQRYTWTTRRIVENKRARFYLGKNGKVEQHPDLITSEEVIVTASALAWPAPGTPGMRAGWPQSTPTAPARG